MFSNDNHIIDYLVLLTGILLSLAVLYFFRYNHTIALIVSFSASSFYAVWGIIHHALEGRLNKLVFLEYTLISLFVFSLSFIVLNF